MTKLAGSVLIMTMCVYMGINASSELKIKIHIIDGLISDLTVLRSRIKNYSEPLPEAFSKLESCPMLWGFCVDRIDRAWEQFSDIWSDAVKKSEYEPEVKTALLPLGNILGTSVAEDEDHAIENTVELLSAIRVRHETEYRVKRGLCTRLGACAGLVIVILLI